MLYLILPAGGEEGAFALQSEGGQSAVGVLVKIYSWRDKSPPPADVFPSVANWEIMDRFAC